MYTDHGVRRYGFHGTSHRHVAQLAAEHLDRPLDELNLITLHLGNGASAAAIQGGRCVDTSMGMTPLEGLVMGTRSGDVDPGDWAAFRALCHRAVDDMVDQGAKLIFATSDDMRDGILAAAAAHPDVVTSDEKPLLRAVRLADRKSVE